MAEHRITLTEQAEIGYQVALETGEESMEKKLNTHYEGLAPMLEKRKLEQEVARLIKVKDDVGVKAAVEAAEAKAAEDAQK